MDRPIRLYTPVRANALATPATFPPTEDTPFRPRSPYAVAKACAQNLVWQLP